jgi:hypothetical protein
MPYTAPLPQTVKCDAHAHPAAHVKPKGLPIILFQRTLISSGLELGENISQSTWQIIVGDTDFWYSNDNGVECRFERASVDIFRYWAFAELQKGEAGCQYHLEYVIWRMIQSLTRVINDQGNESFAGFVK